MGDFAGRVALVMGAGNEWGRAVAVAFARQGALVAANDISPGPLDQTIQAAGEGCHPYLFDAAKKMPVQALIGQVVERFDRLDFLVNAGFVLPAAGLLEMDEWDWHRTLDMNLAGPFFAIQVAGRVMRHQGGGAIVNILLDPDPLLRTPGRAALAASQSALAAVTRLAAVELAAYNIRVNAVALRVTESAAPPGAPPLGRLAHIPLAIATRPEAVAEQVLYLCRAESEDMNGQVFSC
jgi:NAD(P)-dependent dehydrogenase (short-subunit alcohol dehydrogenase family)